MKLEGAIFDFDGTLVDSMFIWENLAFDYLVSLGITPDISINKFAEWGNNYRIKCVSKLQQACIIELAQ